MPRTITLSLPHELPPDEVKRRIVKAIADARRNHADLLNSAREHWTENQLDFTAHAMGQAITGRIAIEAKIVHVSIDLPLMLAMFAGKITPQIESEARKLLDSKT